MMTDPIADQLTRIRNGLAIRRETVDMPFSKMKLGVAQVLEREGYIQGYTIIETTPQSTLRVSLKYGPNDEDVIQSLTRTSRPGRRVFAGVDELAPVRNGLGIQIVSTNQGILSDRECRSRRVGGEVLATVY